MKAGVFMILVRANGEILMQLRDDGKGKHIMFANKWVFPGGVKKSGESYLNTTIREAREEFGFNLANSACEEIMTYNYDNTEETHVFVCRVDSTHVPVLNEGADLRWMKFSEIEKIELGFGQNNILSNVKEALT